MKGTNIYKDVAYSKNKPLITVLLESDFTKEIRIVMHKKTEMKEHKTSYPIIIEILEGNIVFTLKEEIKYLTKGDLITLNGNVPHGLKAIENSIIRLTLSKFDNEKRVEKVIEN
ncbi:AraC family ligand binding domain-containing protein [Tenacibaculum sp. nBUS_03]|uniref:AraC family ligand binding domain-containing protein n=1 Tax=Tenacibaculum sp. nBUS_03 TaxID=3395320 RepID=UPI003EBBF407